MGLVDQPEEDPELEKIQGTEKGGPERGSIVLRTKPGKFNTGTHRESLGLVDVPEDPTEHMSEGSLGSETEP